MDKKKIIIIIGAVVVLIAVIVGLVIGLNNKPDSKGNTSDPTVSAESVETKAGEIVKVPVKFTGNPGAMGYLVEFNYDDEKLEYITTQKGDVVTNCEANAKDGVLKVVTIEDNDVKKDGVLYYISFKPRDGVKGDCEIKVICDENSICNYDEKGIPVKTVDGKITVK